MEAEIRVNWIKEGEKNTRFFMVGPFLGKKIWLKDSRMKMVNCRKTKKKKKKRDWVDYFKLFLKFVHIFSTK